MCQPLPIHLLTNPPHTTIDPTFGYTYEPTWTHQQNLEYLTSAYLPNGNYTVTYEGTDIVVKTTVANLENLRYCDFPVSVVVHSGTPKVEILDAYQCPEAYRYAFNGKESDKEVYGEDNFYDYGFRCYDPRIGRFFSVDPLKDKYPELTTYQFASNRPIDSKDLDGLEAVSIHAEARVMAGLNFISLTSSMSIGIAMDFEYNYVFYSTPTLGLGAGEGVIAGASWSYYPVPGTTVSDLKGFGASLGGFLSISPANFTGPPRFKKSLAGEFNVSLQDDGSFNTAGFSNNALIDEITPSFGAGGGVYVEGTYTSFFGEPRKMGSIMSDPNLKKVASVFGTSEAEFATAVAKFSAEFNKQMSETSGTPKAREGDLSVGCVTSNSTYIDE